MSIEFFGSIMLVLAVSDFGLFQIPMTSFSKFRGNSFIAFLAKSPNKNKNNKNLDQFNIIIIINSIIMIFSFSIKLIIKTNLKCSDWIVLFMFFISHLTTKWEWVEAASWPVYQWLFFLLILIIIIMLIISFIIDE